MVDSMKKIIAAALAVTIILSFAIIQLRPSGSAISESTESGTDEKRSFEDVGTVEVKEGEIISMEILHDIKKPL
jgi:hypothetical protein